MIASMRGQRDVNDTQRKVSCLVPIIGLVIHIGCIASGVQEYKLRTRGIQVQASLEYMSEERTPSTRVGHANRLRTTYHYRFLVDQREYWIQAALNGAPTANVEYVADDPSICRIVGSKSWFPIGPIGIVVGVLMLGFGFFRFGRNDELLND